MSDGETANSGSSGEQRETSSASVAWWHLHRRLYDWVVHFADTPHGERALFGLSFAESSFFLVAGLIGWKGRKIRLVIEKYFNWFALAFMAMLLGGFLLIKWLH